MSRHARTRWCSAALLTAALAGATAASAQEGPGIGGSVASMLSVSVSEPSALSRAAGNAGAYTSSIAVEVTATDAPTRLSVIDGEASAGRRHGHLIRGASVLRVPMQVAVGQRPYRSLGASDDPLLQQWKQPIASAAARIRLRQATPGGPAALNGYHKLLLITVSAAGP
ncbi:MAG: hypothetical protein ACHP9U_07185 [Steroidobacterales bacterium]